MCLKKCISISDLKVNVGCWNHRNILFKKSHHKMAYREGILDGHLQSNKKI